MANIQTTIMEPLKGLAAMSTNAAIVVPAPTTTEPATGTDNKVIDMQSYGSGNQVHITPYGTDANDETLDIAVYAWERVESGANDLYVPTFLGEWTGTLTTSVPGVAGTPVIATEYFCDTIVEKEVPYSLTEIVSGGTGDENVSRILVDTIGFRWIDIRGDLNGSSASWNFLWRVM
jgi:hypothetical protein